MTAPFLDLAVKLAAATIPAGQITTGRFLVQAAIVLPTSILPGQSLRVPTGAWLRLIARAAFLIVASDCFVATVGVMLIAVALAIVFVEPFLLLILSNLIFGDAIAFYPLGTALTFALYMLVTRSVSRQIRPLAMQTHAAWLAALICLPIVILANGSGLSQLDPVMPKGIVWFWLLGVGIASNNQNLMIAFALGWPPQPRSPAALSGTRQRRRIGFSDL